MIIFQLIEVSLDEMVHDDDFGSIDGHDTLIRRIAALHVVYMFNKSQIMWFGQLVSQRPGIMLALKEKQSPDTSEMVVLSHLLVRLFFYILSSFFLLDAPPVCCGEGAGCLEASDGEG